MTKVRCIMSAAALSPAVARRMCPTCAGRHSAKRRQLPSTLLQAGHEQLSQAVAAGSLVWACITQHGSHVDEGQRLSAGVNPCRRLRLFVSDPACVHTPHVATVLALQCLMQI